MSARRKVISDVEYDDNRYCPRVSTKDEQVIEVDDFLEDQPADEKYFVPLDTHLGELPERQRGDQPSDTNDEIRYIEFQYKEEQKYFERVRLAKEKWTIVRQHEEVDTVANEIIKAMDDAGD